jgi:hypothetical protein
MDPNKIYFTGYKLHRKCSFNAFFKEKTNLNDTKEIYFQLLHLLPPNANILQLGCVWTCKPKQNMKKLTDKNDNYLKNENSDNIELFNGYIGIGHYVGSSSFCPLDFRKINTPEYNIKKIIEDNGFYNHIDNENENNIIDILHSDIQGAEVDLLIGSINVLKKIGFFVLFTYSGKSHNTCIDFMTANKFTILIDKALEESVSADGMIIAVNNEHIEKYEKNEKILKNINIPIQKYFEVKESHTTRN